MFKKVLVPAVFAASVSANAFAAATLADADALFAKRDDSVENTKAARAAYQAVIDSGVKDADLVKAAEGLLRAYVYEGNALIAKDTDANKKARKAIFAECNKAVETISPANLGFASPVYFYFKASCTAYEAEVSSPLERLVALPKLLQTLSTGLSTAGGDTYEGGGLKRVKAAVKGNVEAKGLPGGLFNPEEALTLVNEAIEAPAYEGNVDGFLFCENFYRKAVTLQTLDRKAEAKELAAQAVTDFTGYLADGLIPEFIRAETSHCIGQVKALGESL